ncbi:MAG: hypothetical protein AAFQ08_02990, partial [Bacteroidota bacterium]
MVAGFATAAFWSFFMGSKNSIPPGMLANLVVLLGTHYLLGEPGGWQKVDPNSLLGRERAARKEAWEKRLKAIQNFSVYSYLQQNLPAREGVYSWFGLYVILAVYSALYVIAPADVKIYNDIYQGIVHAGMFATAAFLTLPIWPPIIKDQRFITFFWPLGISALLFFAGTLIALMSHFNTMQLMVLVLNFMIAVLLLQWHLAVILAAIGVSAALLFFQYYTGEALPWGALGDLQFRLLYGLMLFVSFCIALFKSKQAYAHLDKKNKALTRLEKEHQDRHLQANLEMQKTFSALQNTGIEELLTISRELHAVQAMPENTVLLQAIRTKLIPIVFQLQGIDTRAQDYLRLQIAPLEIKAWWEAVKEA